MRLVAAIFLIFSLLLSQINPSSAQTPRAELEAMYRDGDLLLAGDATRLLDIDVPSFVLSQIYRTDNPAGWLYPKTNGMPQPDVLNTCFLTPEQLKRIGHAELKTCLAQKSDGLRYIFCNRGDLLGASKAFGKALGGSNGSDLVLARLILGHETAHQFIDHPTLDPQRRVWPAEMLRYEREADASAAEMMAETPLRQVLLKKVFDGSGPQKEERSLMARLLNYFSTGRTTHDDGPTRLRDMAIAITDMYVDGQAYRGLEPNVESLGLDCITGCEEAPANWAVEDLTNLWFSSSILDRSALADDRRPRFHRSPADTWAPGLLHPTE